MDGLRETLDRRIGPLKLWQWVIVVVAGVALGYAARRFLPGGGTDRQLTEPAEGNLSAFSTAPTGAIGVADGVQPGAGQPTITNNDGWLDYASATLRSQSQFSAVDIDTALRRYLGGEPLNTRHVAIVDAALTLVGSPPQGAPSIIREMPEAGIDAAVPSAPQTVIAQPQLAPPTSDAPPSGPQITAEQQRRNDYIAAWGSLEGYPNGRGQTGTPGTAVNLQTFSQVLNAATSTTETPAERKARLERQVASGDRSAASVARSLELQQNYLNQHGTLEGYPNGPQAA